MKLTSKQKESLIHGYNRMRGKLPEVITVKDYNRIMVAESKLKLSKK